MCVNSILLDNAGNNSSLFSKDFDCVKNEGGRNVHWEKALKWAQQSLICKDLFTRVS